MIFTDDQIVELEELFKKFVVFYQKEIINDDNENQCYSFQAKHDPEVYCKFRITNYNHVEIVRNDTLLITKEFRSALLILKYWLVKFQPEREESFTQFQLSKIRLIGNEYDEFCLLQINTNHRIRFISYFNPDHFFEMVPIENNGVKIKRELIFSDGSHQTADRGFENCIIVLKDWMIKIERTVASTKANTDKRDENREILETIEENETTINFQAESRYEHNVSRNENHSLKEIIVQTLKYINNKGYVNVKMTLWTETLELNEDIQNKVKSLLLKLKSVRIKEGEPFTFEITDPRGVSLLRSPNRLTSKGNEKKVYWVLRGFKEHLVKIISSVIIAVIVAIILLFVKPYINGLQDENLSLINTKTSGSDYWKPTFVAKSQELLLALDLEIATDIQIRDALRPLFEGKAFLPEVDTNFEKWGDFHWRIYTTRIIIQSCYLKINDQKKLQRYRQIVIDLQELEEISSLMFNNYKEEVSRAEKTIKQIDSKLEYIRIMTSVEIIDDSDLDKQQIKKRNKVVNRMRSDLENLELI